MDATTLRIIDANLNRATEGLRLLEEHARLAISDETLTAQVKGLRHALADVGKAFGRDALLTARDIQHDVGTMLSTDAERTRTSTADVAGAAAKRAAESLRCIEEYGKIINREAAARAEQLRYKVYAIEQSILIAGPRRSKLNAARLHVIITEALCDGSWLTVCEQAIAGGADVLQLREKAIDDRELLDRAGKLRALTRDRDVLLIINDRADIARLVDADGVHVGQHDLSVSEARQIAGPHLLVGASTHSIAEAHDMLQQRPDYIAVGPMFSSRTKPDVAVQGPPLLENVTALADLPVVAIGGITQDNVTSLKAHRSFQIAVCQAVIRTRDTTDATRDLKQLLISESRDSAD